MKGVSSLFARQIKMSEENEKMARDQHRVLGISDSLGEELRSPGNAWFFEGGLLGLFIHFGISTVRGEGDLFWGMIDATPSDALSGGNYTITPREYWEQAKSFNPEKYDPDNWLRAAKEAGFTYAVFTTRHHDGFSMWPSDYGSLNTKNFMKGRDLVREYVDACRRNGLRVGLYYSPPDWYVERYCRSFYWTSWEPDKYPDAKPGGLDHEEIDEVPAMPPALLADYRRYISDQIRELLTKYGKIDVLWFDGGLPDLDGMIPMEEIISLQPDIAVNDRIYGRGYHSGYECSLPEEKPPQFFEHCDIWMENCGWAHMNRCTGYRSAEWLYEKYKKVRDWGGNVLIDVGPRADGTLPEIYYRRMAEFKELLERA